MNHTTNEPREQVYAHLARFGPSTREDIVEDSGIALEHVARALAGGCEAGELKLLWGGEYELVPVNERQQPSESRRMIAVVGESR